ncbi:MAG: 4-hydroxyphenylacetate 3-hydroxylase N-terminal domain-containing protein [Chloroflexota bacterium]
MLGGERVEDTPSLPGGGRGYHPRVAARDGQAYLRGLADGREVWHAGQRVADVTREPRLARGAASVAMLYDAQVDPATRDLVTWEDKSGERQPVAFLPPRTLADLQRRRAAFQTTASLSGGVLGRTPDYINTFVLACAANHAYFARNDAAYGENARRYLEHCQRNDLCLTHTFVAPQIDVAAARRNQADRETALRVVEERDEGIVVRGARILATLAPIADEVVVVRQAAGDCALAFAVPMATPGLRIICRESLDEGRATFDRPLSSRFDEVDAYLIFQDVLVPWERVFLHDPEGKHATLFSETTAYTHVIHQFTTRNWVKAQLMLGVAHAMAETVGASEIPAVQETLGEMVAVVETLRALLVASEAEAEPDVEGLIVPRRETLRTARSYFPRQYGRLVEILQRVGSSGLLTTPTDAELAEDLPIAADVATYFRGIKTDARARAALFRLGWDLCASSFAGRHALYERHFAGSPEGTLARQYRAYDRGPALALVQRLLGSGQQVPGSS